MNNFDDAVKDIFPQAACMLCGGIGVSFVNNLRDDLNRWAVRCNVCGHIQVYPLPEDDEIRKYYEENYHKKRNFESDQSDEEKINFYEGLDSMRKNTLLCQIPDNSNVLEIGSGYGWFLEKIKDSGVKIDGVEINQDMINFVQNRSGIKMINHNFVYEIAPKTMYKAYDVIFMFDVLEHVRNPVVFLNNVKTCLKHGGLLFVEVPNFDDGNKEYSKAYNDFLYIYQHLSYFTPEALKFTLKQAGFTDILIKGMQRYSIENAIWWVRNNKPHTDYQQLELPEHLEWVNKYYKNVIEEKLRSDNILGIGKLY